MAVISSIHLRVCECFLKNFCPGRCNKPCLFQYGGVGLWFSYWFIRLHNNNALSEIQEEKQVALLSCLDLRGWLDPLITKEKIPSVKTSVSSIFWQMYLGVEEHRVQYEIATCTSGDQVLDWVKTSGVLSVRKWLKNNSLKVVIFTGGESCLFCVLLGVNRDHKSRAVLQETKILMIYKIVVGA